MWGSKPQLYPPAMPVAATPIAPVAPAAQAPTGITPADTTESEGPNAPATTMSMPESEGKISGDEDLRVDSLFEDPIALKCSRLTFGRKATVTAKVTAREVVVYGNVHGTLKARDCIEIKKNASVIGDVTTARISIEDGAYFRGKIEIERRKRPRGVPQI
jgi:cytoskeletal protein CcmA (bactofilin family)